MTAKIDGEKAAHDFNNLMTAILGYSSLLLMNPLLPKALRGEVEKIRSAASSAATLVESIAPHQGTPFMAPPAGQPQAAVNTRQTDAGGRDVLVVEDDRETRELFREALRMAGFTVRTAVDGLTALLRVEERAPDLIVLDLDLPVLSGLAVQEELEARPETHHLPVVIVTGTDMQSPIGAAARLTKPIPPDQLVDVVHKTLGARP